jgi:hypothetical protein
MRDMDMRNIYMRNIRQCVRNAGPHRSLRPPEARSNGLRRRDSLLPSSRLLENESAKKASNPKVLKQ